MKGKKRLQGQEYIRIKTKTTKLVIVQLISWMEKSFRYRVLIFRKSLDIRRFFFLLAFVNNFTKTLSTPTVTFRDAHLLQSTNTQPIFSFYSFFINSKLKKREGEMKEAYFKYIFPKKKIRKENKTKTKTKCTNKEKHTSTENFQIRK